MVNDNSKVLIKLSKKLFSQGVVPYYLNLLDRVRGTQHFEVDEVRAIELHKEIQAHLPGYLVPKLIREIEGKPNKSIIS